MPVLGILHGREKRDGVVDVNGLDLKIGCVETRDLQYGKGEVIKGFNFQKRIPGRIGLPVVADGGEVGIT